MTARDEIHDILNDHREYLNPDHLLDEYAMETIRKVAVSMRRAWKADHFGSPVDGVVEAMEYLINLTSDKGEIRTGVIGRDFMSWLYGGTDA